MATSFKELRVWQNGVDLAMRVFELTRAFPREERYSLTDQFRRATRSIPSNISEAWRKRRYVASFVSKLSDSESEAAESQTWIELALRCRHIDAEIARELDAMCEQGLAQLSTMIREADSWCLPPGTR
jgi:four helix bundle protein